jgi:hypothetical protein
VESRVEKQNKQKNKVIKVKGGLFGRWRGRGNR